MVDKVILMSNFNSFQLKSYLYLNYNYFKIPFRHALCSSTGQLGPMAGPWISWIGGSHDLERVPFALGLGGARSLRKVRRTSHEPANPVPGPRGGSGHGGHVPTLCWQYQRRRQAQQPAPVSPWRRAAKPLKEPAVTDQEASALPVSDFSHRTPFLLEPSCASSRPFPCWRH